jgi:hypothetical protein
MGIIAIRDIHVASSFGTCGRSGVSRVREVKECEESSIQLEE